jgi:hypothetical protein
VLEIRVINPGVLMRCGMKVGTGVQYDCDPHKEPLKREWEREGEREFDINFLQIPSATDLQRVRSASAEPSAPALGERLSAARFKEVKDGGSGHRGLCPLLFHFFPNITASSLE